MARSLPRVVVLIDMDCFYAGVEQRERPELRGKPVVVVQGHEFKGGGIIAVSYEAREFGVTRNMRANEAVAKCPELAVCYVPERHGKADLTRYRSVGAEVIKVVSRFADVVERASVDEAFLDVTEAVQKRLARGDVDLQNLDAMLPLIPSTFAAGFPSLVARTEASTSLPGASCTADVSRPVQPEATLHVTRRVAQGPSALWTASGDDDGDGFDEELLGVDGDGLAVDEDVADGEATTVAAVAAASDSEESLRAWHDTCRDEQSLALLVGAVIASEMRHAVLTEAGVSCSAGVAENKMLAKLACGLHKPAQQTILPMSSVPGVFADLPFKKVRNLGGSFGKTVQATLNCTSVGAVAAFPAADLQRHFGEKMGCWLFGVCRGICREPMRERRLAQSLGSSKNFPGPKKLVSHEQIRYWLLQYSKELVERISVDEAMNDRLPSHFSVHALHEGEEKSLARSCRCPGSVFSSVTELMEKAYFLLLSSARPRPRALGPESERPGASPWLPGVVNIGICADQFKSIKATKNTANITQFFRAPASAQASSSGATATSDSATKPQDKKTVEVAPAPQSSSLASENASVTSAEAMAVAAVGGTTCVTSDRAVAVTVTSGTSAVHSHCAGAVSTATGRASPPSHGAVAVPVASAGSALSYDCAGAVSTEGSSCPTIATVRSAPLSPGCAVDSNVTGGGSSVLPSVCDAAVSSPSGRLSSSSAGSATLPATSGSATPSAAHSVAAGSASEPVVIADVVQLPGPWEMPPLTTDVDSLVFSTEDWQRCKLCGNGVFAWMIPEHRDFHFAQSLKAQDRLAMRPASEARKMPLPSPGSKTATAKARSPQRNKSTPSLSCRTPRTFFQAPSTALAAGSAVCPASSCAYSATGECTPLSTTMSATSVDLLPARKCSSTAGTAASAGAAIASVPCGLRSSSLSDGAGVVSTVGGDSFLRSDPPEAVTTIRGNSSLSSDSPHAVLRASGDIPLARTAAAAAAAAALPTHAGSVPLSTECAMAVSGTTSPSAEFTSAVPSTSGDTGVSAASAAGSADEPLSSDDIFETPGHGDAPPLTVDDSLVYSLDDWQLCRLCGKGVSSSMIPEHRDFHFAESLREQDRLAMKAASEARKTPLPSPASKRVKTPQRNTPKPKPSCRPITTFFGKKSTSSP